jgi:hypothetical protein
MVTIVKKAHFDVIHLILSQLCNTFECQAFDDLEKQIVKHFTI